MSREAEEYAQLHAILSDARGLDGERRAAYLADACGSDDALRARAEALLTLGADDDAQDAFSDGHVAGVRGGLEEIRGEPTSAWLPEKIGDYTIVRRLGHGGMGVVYEAEQKSPHRRVAIKLLHPMQATADRLRRFRHEAELLGRLQHPGIAAIYEAGTFDAGRGSQPFFAMELVDGVDIRTHCERNGLDRAARIELLASVADAVQYAHDRGIVHRDLKPDNVLVGALGRPRILDFGIARATSSSASLSTIVTEEGRLVGTLQYLAPEQLGRSGAAVSPQVDVYALGVLGFELLVGRPPREIEDLSISQAITLLATSDAARASAYDTSLRGDVETILGTALASEPDRRYDSAAALAGDLRRHLAHQPIRARPPSRVYLVRKFARRHRALVGGTLATLLVLLAGVVVAAVLADQARDQRDVAVANERAAHNALLQATQTLVDAGRGRDAAAQLRLIPEAARGVAWRLLDRAVPFVLDAPPGHWRFVNDELLVGVYGSGFADPADLSPTTALYSLTEHRAIRTLFPGLQIGGIGRPAMNLVPAPVGERGVNAGVMLLDLERETVVARRPAHSVRSYATDVVRFPEVSDDGRTVLWYTSESDAEPRGEGTWFTSESDAEVRVDGTVVRAFRGLAPEESVHIGPDGRILVENRRGSVTVLDVATGAEWFRYEFEPDTPESQPERSTPMACGLPVSGGVLLVSGPERSHWVKSLTIRRLALTDEGMEQADDPFSSGFVTWGYQYSITSSRDGRLVAVVTPGGAKLGDPQTGAPLRIEGVTIDVDDLVGYIPFDGVPAVTFDIAPSGRRVAISSQYAQTEIIELDPRMNDPQFDQRVMTLRGHRGAGAAPDQTGDGWIYHLAVSNDGSLIASAAPLDPLVRLWDARTGDCVATLERDCEDPGSWDALMAFTPDDDRVMMTTPYAGRGVCVVEWNLLTGDAVVRAEMNEPGATHLELLDVFIDALGPLPGARLSQRAQMQTSGALAVLHPDTHAQADVDNRAWRAEEGRRWRYVPDNSSVTSAQSTGWIAGVSVQPNAPRVAAVMQTKRAGVRDGRLCVTDANTDELLLERGLTYRPWCVAYHPDGSVLAIGAHEGRVLLFETEGYTQQLEWAAHDSYVYSLAWTPDGTRLVTASGDATLRIWDTRTRVASLRAEDEWKALQSEMAGREDLRDAFTGMTGTEREAARVELIRRAQANLRG